MLTSKRHASHAISLDKQKHVPPNKMSSGGTREVQSVAKTPASACGACVRRAGLARAEKSLGAGRHECPRHVGFEVGHASKELAKIPTNCSTPNPTPLRSWLCSVTLTHARTRDLSEPQP